MSEPPLLGAVPTLTQPQSSTQTDATVEKEKRKRARGSRACDACRRMKIKCVTEQGDVCDACKSTNRPCTFVHEGTKRERPPTKRDIEALNTKIRGLERILQSVAPGIDLTLLPRTADQARSIVNATRKGIPANFASPDSDSDEYESAVEDSAGISIEPGRYVGSHSALSVTSFSELQKVLQSQPLRDLDSDQLLQDTTRSLAERLSEREHRKQRANDTAFPPPDLAASLINLYFSHVHEHHFVLHQAFFTEQYNSGTWVRDTAFRALCHAVFAAASRFSQDPRVLLDFEGNTLSPQAAGAMYGAASATLVSSPSLPCTLYDLQCTAILSSFLIASSSPTRAWAFSGLGLRRAQDVGVHREKNPLWTTSVLRDQLRKRAFWQLWAINKNVSFVLGRSSCIREVDSDLEPPLFVSDDVITGLNVKTYGRDALSTKPLWINVRPQPDDYRRIGQEMFWKIRKRVTLGFEKLYSLKRDHEANQPSNWDQQLVLELDAELTDFHHRTPAWLRWSPDQPDDNLLMIAGMHAATYHYVQILIHRNLLGSNNGQNSSIKVCTNAARQVAAIFERFRDRGLLERMIYLGLFPIITATLILFHVLGMKTDQFDEAAWGLIRNDAETCLNLLRTLAPKCFIAERVYHSLEQIRGMKEASDAASSAAVRAPGFSPLQTHQRDSTADFNASPLSWPGDLRAVAGLIADNQNPYVMSPQSSYQGSSGGPFLTSEASLMDPTQLETYILTAGLDLPQLIDAGASSGTPESTGQEALTSVAPGFDLFTEGFQYSRTEAQPAFPDFFSASSLTPGPFQGL